MQLSKLEIKGFKSFGDKVTVHFDNGITGIVGPNGCGKSNIVDAIRWVLGEQKTRALRSEKMENVIFNGTKNRKALQMAEVSMTFINSRKLLPVEYTEVTITRRYYRSGESEYLLNNVSCRLKDINDLFLDTGIGPDSYAIIELKMVDDILNDKDNSRRTLFEEAAGISKFKLRKKQTLKKLQDTDKDLERVEDILFEIEKNLKSLERQAKQAEKYTETKELYKKASIQLSKLSLTDDKLALENLNNNLQKEQARKEELNAKFKNFDAETEKLKAELLHKEKLVSSRQKTFNEQINKIRQYESEKKIKNERQRFLKDKTESLSTQIESDKELLETSYVEVKRIKESHYQTEQNLEDLQKELDQLKKAYEAEKESAIVLKERIQVENRNYQEQREELYNLKKSLEVNLSRLETLKEEFDKSHVDSNTQRESLLMLENKLKDSAERINTESKALLLLEEEDKKDKNKIAEIEGHIESTKDQLLKINRSIDSKQNEYNLTKSLVDNLEGFPEAIKFLKKNTTWSDDALLLSDIVTCDEKYRVAIENFLEPYMNYYVVEDFQHAFQAVNMLTKSSKGRANFFVLEAFEKNTANNPVDINQCVSALSILEFDSKHEKLLSYLLKDVYITSEENLDQLNQPDFTFITDNGKLIKKALSVTGGSVGLFEGKRIGRLKNLEKLQEQIKKLNKEKEKVKFDLEKIQQNLANVKGKDTQNKITEKQKELNLVNQEHLSIKLKEEQLRDLIESNSSKREDIQQNVRILEEAIAKNQPQLDLKEATLSGVEENITQLNEELNRQNDAYNEKSTAYNQKNIQLHQTQNKISQLDQELDFRDENISKLKIALERNTSDLQKTDGEIQKLLHDSDENDDELISLYEEKEAIEKGVQEAEKDFFAHRGNIDQKETDSKDIRRNVELSSQLILDIQNSINELKLALTSTKERLRAEFNVDLNQLLFEEDTEENNWTAEDLKDQIEKHKDRLHKMGPINPMAVEAYEEIKERYEFITTQKGDLETSRESLNKTIKEIDAVARENFLSSFESIKANFIKVFRSLFTEEDRCDLKLADESNPLESSIDILAQPKGKRPLSINQLSGGEKTLTAVALLFSIYLLKPAPFCIFDEVDAPLDDANIDKFNNIIREFSKESQFILVTHNKRTMSTTDIMYGVTMRETGVSKLVPVDLRSLDEIVPQAS